MSRPIPATRTPCFITCSFCDDEVWVRCAACATTRIGSSSVSGSAVEDEWRPIVGTLVLLVDQMQLRRPERGSGVASPCQLVVHGIHEHRGGAVADVPLRGDDAFRAGVEERPG